MNGLFSHNNSLRHVVQPTLLMTIIKFSVIYLLIKHCGVQFRSNLPEENMGLFENYVTFLLIKKVCFIFINFYR